MEGDPAGPRKAATLLLVRNTADDLEVFMVERPGAGVFSGLHVFPGGKVDGQDVPMEDLCEGLDDAEASRRLGMTSGGVAYWAAAIRESFEEAGAVLCYRERRIVDMADAGLARRFAEYRDAVHAGRMSLSEVCRREGLRLATDRVHYFSHWITPEGAPRRFDTRFFVAEMPPGQHVVHREGELEDGLWIRPGEALSLGESGQWQMIHPTTTTLDSLVRYSTVRELMDAVAGRHHLPEVTAERRAQGMREM